MSNEEPAQFLNGINLHPSYLKTHSDRLIEILSTTKIEWLRIHPLPTRKLDKDHFEGLDKFCKARYNLIVPIDVGVIDNVGEISLDALESFVDESYEYSRRAVSEISRITREHGRRVIYGIENEIDTKEWFLQSLPIVGWRKSFEAWFRLATDIDLKYKRLNNVLKGVRDADPDAMVMTNVEADDLGSFVSNIHGHLTWSEKILRKNGLIDTDLLNYLTDWKVELQRVKQKLPVDLVGLDNYPNYLTKYPVGGQDIGVKLDEAIEISGRPAINSEFGYTTYRAALLNFWYRLRGIPSASRLQLGFFQNALRSIAGSRSRGTFPWVLVTEPRKKSNPAEENGFGVLKVDARGEIREEPSFGHYANWLQAR